MMRFLTEDVTQKVNAVCLPEYFVAAIFAKNHTDGCRRSLATHGTAPARVASYSYIPDHSVSSY